MHHRLTMISSGLAMALAVVPLSTATAQYYPPPCSPFPLAWPFCVAGAIVGTAVTIVSAPIWLLTGAPLPFYYGHYRPPPYFPPPVYPSAPGYYPPPNYYGPR